MTTIRIPLQRDAIQTSACPVGSLAADLFGAETALLRAELKLEELLDSLYGRSGWQDYEWDRALALLDVYGVTPSGAAVETFARAGFKFAVQHEHVSREFVKCGCRVRTL